MAVQNLARGWKAVIALGLLSSSYSTLVSELAAGRIGRDAAVDWMTVAAIPARDWILSTEPTWSSSLIGIAFHQWADFSWAVVFFGILHRLTWGLNPWQLSLAAIPWAMLTSGLEWLFLVPLVPFWQPLLLDRVSGASFFGIDLPSLSVASNHIVQQEIRRASRRHQSRGCCGLRNYHSCRRSGPRTPRTSMARSKADGRPNLSPEHDHPPRPRNRTCDDGG